MKTVAFIFLVFSISLTARGQALDGIDSLSAELVAKLQAVNKKKIVVLPFADTNGKTTATGRELADMVTLFIVQAGGNSGIQALDREQASTHTQAKKLLLDAGADAEKCRELARAFDVEAIITGSYRQDKNSFYTVLKCVDAHTGFIVAASMRSLRLHNSPTAGTAN
jgi:TolB-like protein